MQWSIRGECLIWLESSFVCLLRDGMPQSFVCNHRLLQRGMHSSHQRVEAAAEVLRERVVLFSL